MAVSAVAYPDMRITSTSGWISLEARNRSMPLSPGMTRSVRITSNRPLSSWSIPSVPDRASVTSHPFDRRIEERRETIIGSSSTTRTRFRGFRFMSRFLPANRPKDGGPAAEEDDHQGRHLEVPVARSADLLRGRAVLVRPRLDVVRRGGGWQGGRKGEEQAEGEKESGENPPRPRTGEDPTLAVRARTFHRLVYTTNRKRAPQAAHRSPDRPRASTRYPSRWRTIPWHPGHTVSSVPGSCTFPT